MADVTNQLMYELLQRVHQQGSELRQDVAELKRELNVVRGHMIGIQSDIHNIYGILARHDERLDRIERRPEIREFSEVQPPFDPRS